MSLHQSEVLQLELPARATYLHILSDCIADMFGLISTIGNDETLIYQIQLAAHEACTNIVNHAYAGKPIGENSISICLALHPDPLRLEIKLRDSGHSFDPELVPLPDLEHGQVHGYGLFLIRSVMDTVTYTSQAGTNHWHLVKHL